MSYFQALILGIGLLLANLLAIVGALACFVPFVLIWAVTKDPSPVPPVAWTPPDFSPFSIAWIISSLLGVLAVVPLVLRWWLWFRYPGFSLAVRRPATPDEVSRPKYLDTLQMAVVYCVLAYPVGWSWSRIHFSDGSLAMGLGLAQMVLTACVQAFVVVKFPYYRGFRLEVVRRARIANALA